MLMPNPLTLYFAGIVVCSRRLHMQRLLSVLLAKCWTAEVIEVCEGLSASNRYTKCVKAAIPLPFQDFVVNLQERLRAVWRELDGADPRIHAHELAIYHAWMASPLKPSTARGSPHLLPRYLQLELSRHVLCNTAHFYLRAHTLIVETGYWQIHNKHCDNCDLVSRMKHMSFSYALACKCAIWEGNLQDNLLISLGLIEFTLGTQEPSTLTPSKLRM